MNSSAVARLLVVGLAVLGWGCDDGSDAGGPTPVQLPRDMGTVVKPPRPDAGPVMVEDDAAAPEGDGAVEREDGGVEPPDDDAAPPMGCAEGEARPCPDGCGQQTCSDGNWGACDGEATLERCNNADDDCDGRIDETFNELGVGCTVQDGACTAQGVHICNEDGSGVVCQAEPVAPQEEVCDGVDNDCDDNVDEGFEGQLCCTEDIHCPPGVMCMNGMCAGGPGPGPNPGDQCRTPIEMANFGAYPNDLAQGSATHFSSECDGLFGQELVYSFQLDEDARVRLDTRGSLADTILYVRTTCEDDASEIICNDDDPNAGFLEAHSVVEFNAAAGTRYYVFVDSLGFNLLGTSTVLNFSTVANVPDPPDPPDPENCRDEFDCEIGQVCEDGACVDAPMMPECMGDGDCPGDQMCEDGECRLPPPPPAAPLCEAPQMLEAFGTFRGTTAGRPDQATASCQANATGGELAFVIQHDVPTAVLLDTTNSSFDSVVSVRTDCEDPMSEVACDDDGGERGAGALVFVAERDVPYTVIIDGYDGESGDVELLYDGRAYDFCVDGLCFFQPTGSCAMADRLDMGRAMGNTAELQNRLNPPARCGNSTSPDAIYAFAFREDTDVVVHTRGSDFDTILYVLDSECGPIIECNDDTGGVTSEVRFRAQARTLYFAVVDGFRGATGDFVLTVAPQ